MVRKSPDALLAALSRPWPGLASPAPRTATPHPIDANSQPKHLPAPALGLGVINRV